MGNFNWCLFFILIYQWMILMYFFCFLMHVIYWRVLWDLGLYPCIAKGPLRPDVLSYLSQLPGKIKEAGAQAKNGTFTFWKSEKQTEIQSVYSRIQLIYGSKHWNTGLRCRTQVAGVKRVVYTWYTVRYTQKRD